MCKTEKAMLNEIHLTWLFLFQKNMEVLKWKTKKRNPIVP